MEGFWVTCNNLVEASVVDNCEDIFLSALSRHETEGLWFCPRALKFKSGRCAGWLFWCVLWLAISSLNVSQPTMAFFITSASDQQVVTAVALIILRRDCSLPSSINPC